MYMRRWRKGLACCIKTYAPMTQGSCCHAAMTQGRCCIKTHGGNCSAMLSTMEGLQGGEEPTIDLKASKLVQSGDLQYTPEGTIDETCPGIVEGSGIMDFTAKRFVVSCSEWWSISPTRWSAGWKVESCEAGGSEDERELVFTRKVGIGYYALCWCHCGFLLMRSPWFSNAVTQCLTTSGITWNRSCACCM